MYFAWNMFPCCRLKYRERGTAAPFGKKFRHVQQRYGRLSLPASPLFKFFVCIQLELRGQLGSSNQMQTSSSSSDTIKTVTEATFRQLVLEGTGPIVVEFMSYGCGFCRAIEPILQQVADKLHSKQKFFRVNVPVETELASTYAIEGTPTFVMFLDGAEMGRAEGPQPTLAGITATVTGPFEARNHS